MLTHLKWKRKIFFNKIIFSLSISLSFFFLFCVREWNFNFFLFHRRLLLVVWEGSVVYIDKMVITTRGKKEANFIHFSNCDCNVLAFFNQKANWIKSRIFANVGEGELGLKKKEGKWERGMDNLICATCN